MRQRVIIDEVIEFRPLRHGNVQRIFDSGAVDRDLSPVPEQYFHTAVREEPEFSFPKKTKNPNPSPIEKRFGFSWFGADKRT
jgi:hypothetical protein